MHKQKSPSTACGAGLILLALALIPQPAAQEAGHTLTVSVQGLRNEQGCLLVSLYNKDGSIPDEHFKKQMQQLRGAIHNKAGSVTFTGLPQGRYATSILHDENNDSSINKGRILPIEGIGFSNYRSINPLNRPGFQKASFLLQRDTAISVDVIYW